MPRVLREYPSATNPNKKYQVLMGSDEVTYCSCPGWKMSKKCKHLVAWAMESTGQLPQEDVDKIMLQAYKESVSSDDISKIEETIKMGIIKGDWSCLKLNTP